MQEYLVRLYVRQRHSKNADLLTFALSSWLPVLCPVWHCRDYKVVSLYSRFRYKPSLPAWYPPLPIYQSLLLRLRTLGLFIDDHQDFTEEMKEKRIARGKAPPKKGEWLIPFLASLSTSSCRPGEAIKEEKEKIDSALCTLSEFIACMHKADCKFHVFIMHCKQRKCGIGVHS